MAARCPPSATLLPATFYPTTAVPLSISLAHEGKATSRRHVIYTSYIPSVLPRRCLIVFRNPCRLRFRILRHLTSSSGIEYALYVLSAIDLCLVNLSDVKSTSVGMTLSSLMTIESSLRYTVPLIESGNEDVGNKEQVLKGSMVSGI